MLISQQPLNSVFTEKIAVHVISVKCTVLCMRSFIPYFYRFTDWSKSI